MALSSGPVPVPVPVPVPDLFFLGSTGIGTHPSSCSCIDNYWRIHDVHRTHHHLGARGGAGSARRSLAEREVVTFVVATTNQCHYCVAMHSRIAAESIEVAALRDGRPMADARLEAVRRLTLAVIAARGAASDEELAAFEAAGFGAQHALEVVVGVATYTLSTFANRVTRAPLDGALEPYRWPWEDKPPELTRRPFGLAQRRRALG